MFISTKVVSDIEHIVSILNKNRSMDGLYKNVSLFRKREVYRWFGKKDKAYVCFLSTSKKDDKTNIGCAVVFFEILQNPVLISITHTKIQSEVDGKERHFFGETSRR